MFIGFKENSEMIIIVSFNVFHPGTEVTPSQEVGNLYNAGSIYNCDKIFNFTTYDESKGFSEKRVSNMKREKHV